MCFWCFSSATRRPPSFQGSALERTAPVALPHVDCRARISQDSAEFNAEAEAPVAAPATWFRKSLVSMFLRSLLKLLRTCQTHNKPRWTLKLSHGSRKHVSRAAQSHPALDTSVTLASTGPADLKSFIDRYTTVASPFRHERFCCCRNFRDDPFGHFQIGFFHNQLNALYGCDFC